MKKFWQIGFGRYHVSIVFDKNYKYEKEVIEELKNYDITVKYGQLL